MLDSDTRTRLGQAFPASLAAELGHVLAMIEPDPHPVSPPDSARVLVDGEWLHLPVRVYFPVPDEERRTALPETQRRLLACLYTRHHNGWVREANLRRIIRADDPWVVPYVVQLLGEYVIEILDVIDANRDVLARDSYRRFVAANPDFLDLTRQRVISYWNEYYRRRFRKFGDYVGHRLLQAMGVV